MARSTRSDGISLAKGPVGLIGLALLAYGITGLIFGGQSFSANPMSGMVNGTKWLGLEGNGWTNVLFAGAGLLLLLGSPMHWGAKSLALTVGLVLGAASVISLVDGDDVFGIFAANGLTSLVWGVAASLLLVLALLPRVGRKRTDDVAERDVATRNSGTPERFRRSDPVYDDVTTSGTGSRSARRTSGR